MTEKTFQRAQQTEHILNLEEYFEKTAQGRTCHVSFPVLAGTLNNNTGTCFICMLENQLDTCLTSLKTEKSHPPFDTQSERENLDQDFECWSDGCGRIKQTAEFEPEALQIADICSVC